MRQRLRMGRGGKTREQCQRERIDSLNLSRVSETFVKKVCDLLVDVIVLHRNARL